MRRIRNISAHLCAVLSMSAALAGCATTYKTPGRGADLPGVFADGDIADILARRPAAALPTSMAIVRVQEPHYYSATASGYGHGRFSVVTVRDVEKDVDFERIAQSPEIDRVVPLNRLLLSDQLDSDRQLRQAAAALHAGVLLIYTFDTSFFIHDALRPLSVVTLGFSPNQQTRVTTTASAVLIDVRTGYVYGACETTAIKAQLASAWTSRDAVDRARLSTEREAFVNLLTEFEGLWQAIVDERRNEPIPASAS